MAELTDAQRRALSNLREQDRNLNCGSGSCLHKRGGQFTNGPCRCYPADHPMRLYVFAVSALLKAFKDVTP